MTYPQARELILKSFRENEALYKEKLEDIEKYRKGERKVRILDKKGTPVLKKRVKITQKTHEIKYGANIFLLDEFPTQEGNKIPNIANYGFMSPAMLEFRGLLDRGVSIDKIGMQHHAFIGVTGDQLADMEWGLEYFNAEYIDKGLKYMETLGKPMEITEITIPCLGEGPEGEECQAELLKYLYTYFFACPKMESIVYWNTVDDMCFTDTSTANWIENNCRAGLFRRDLTPKPAALMLKKLFGEIWHTELEAETDDDGYLTFRGFFGDYEASFDGGTMSFEHRKRNR